MMAYALYAEHVLYLDPCPLCVFQRMATIGLGIVFLVAALHNPSGTAGRYVYSGAVFAASAAGVGKVPACGPGFGYIIDSFPLADALKMIFTGSGECATTDWSFLGLSMPAWVLISLALLGLFGLWNNLRRV